MQPFRVPRLPKHHAGGAPRGRLSCIPFFQCSHCGHTQKAWPCRHETQRRRLGWWSCWPHLLGWPRPKKEETPTLSVGLREIYRQQSKPAIWESSIPLQAPEGRKRKARNLFSQFPQSFFVLVPVCLVSPSQLLLITCPHPQLATLALVSMTIHFMISTHQQQKCPDF